MSRRNSPSKGDRGGDNHGRPFLTGNPSKRNVASIAPPPLGKGQDRCPVCRNAVTLNPTGTLRRHLDLFGYDCFNRAVNLNQPTGITAPPVRLPLPVTAPSSSTNTTPPNGHCQECEKRIPPGRRLCGRCMSRRS